MDFNYLVDVHRRIFNIDDDFRDNLEDYVKK